MLAGLLAALQAGLLVGAGDAWLAWRQFVDLPPSAIDALRLDSAGDLALGWAGASLVWSALIALPLMLAGLLFKGRLGRQGLLWAGLSFGLFALLYWHTRELIYPGQKATSPGRLAAAAGLLIASGVIGALAAAVSTRGPRWISAIWTSVAAVAVLGGAGVIYTEDSSGDGRGALNERNQDVPNVLLIIVDALRADVLGAYGNAIAHTPVLDQLADEGTVFENALVQAPFTGASFGSFFTGKYPRRHGLLTMAPGVRIEPGLNFARMLKSAQLASGERLQPDDLDAVSFMTGALSHGSGLMEGFDAYRELMLGHPLVELGNRWSVFRSKLVPFRLWSKVEGKLDSDLLANDARQWLSGQADRRFAMFLHLYSTHTPYDPPERFRELFLDEDYEGPFESFYAVHRTAIERGDYELTPEDVRRIADLYMAGVAQADHQIGIVLDELRAAGILDDTIVIVSSDHGEDLGAGATFDPASGAQLTAGRWEHNHMYRSNLHVPLIVRWPAGFPAGTRIGQLVESVDLLPTIAEAAGIVLPLDPAPGDVVDGRSLLPLLRGASVEHKPYTFAEDATFVSISDERYMLTLERFAVKPDAWDLALESGLGQIRFHDLEAHPSGEKDLFDDIVRGAVPAVAGEANRAKLMTEIDRLRAALLEWNDSMPIDVEDVERSDRDLETDANARAQVQNLEYLGYVTDWDAYHGDLREAVEAAREEATAPAEAAARQAASEAVEEPK